MLSGSDSSRSQLDESIRQRKKQANGSIFDDEDVESFDDVELFDINSERGALGTNTAGNS